MKRPAHYPDYPDVRLAELDLCVLGDAPIDALVVGAGPAGLTTAMYLVRFKRRVRVIHDGLSRALWVPKTHNAPGFPEGITGEALIVRMDDHARRYGADIQSGHIVSCTRDKARR